VRNIHCFPNILCIFNSESQSESTHLFKVIKQKYQRNGHIERLMNPAQSYPIEQSYINLAIVETKNQKEKEMQLHAATNIDAIMGSFEEIYGTKTVIDIKNIFETCKNQEKQMLIFGRAGIGKSTFCQYVAYQWATGSYWPQYELLALIPLRRLTINRYPPLPPGQSYSLIDLVKKEVFPYDVSESEDKLLKKHFDAQKTLWILDGYDEIVQNLPAHLEFLFEQLLKTPHHILTSRPYQNTLAYHVQMEITGFTDKNIQQYVQQFFDQMRDELDNASTKSQKLFTFLRTNPSIWGVAHIPVNLELICSLWSNEDLSETKEFTITALYTMMTEWLCRRYFSDQIY
jgi:predicted NACHT family NTPase